MESNPYQSVLSESEPRPVATGFAIAFSVIPLGFAAAIAGMIYCTANQILPPAKISWFLCIAMIWLIYGLAGVTFSAIRFQAIWSKVLGCLWSIGWATLGVLFSGWCIFQINATI